VANVARLSGAELRPAFRPARIDHGSSCACFHSRPETMSSFTFDFTGLESALHKAYPEFFGRLSKKASDFTRNYGVMSMFLGSLRRVVDKNYSENFCG